MDNSDVHKLVRSIGQGPTKTLLETLARNKQFKSAIETPIGIEFLMDIVKSIKDRVDLILNEKDTPETRAEIRAYKSILIRWSDRINQADKDQMRFNKITERI